MAADRAAAAGDQKSLLAVSGLIGVDFVADDNIKQNQRGKPQQNVQGGQTAADDRLFALFFCCHGVEVDHGLGGGSTGGSVAEVDSVGHLGEVAGITVAVGDAVKEDFHAAEGNEIGVFQHMFRDLHIVDSGFVGAVIISENVDGLTIFFCAENIGVMTADAAVGQTDIVGIFASDGHGVAVDLKNFTTHFFVKNCESCIVCHNFSTYLKLQTQWVNKL